MATFVGVASDGVSPGTVLLNLTFSGGITIQVGDLVVVGIKWEGTANDVTSVTDTNGVVASYQVGVAKQTHTNGDLYGKLYYGITQNTSALTVQVNCDDAAVGCRAMALLMRPGSGPGFTGTPLTSQSANNEAGTSISAGSVSAPARGAAVMFAYEYASVDWTQGGSWTIPTGGENGMAGQYQLVAAAGTVNGDITNDNTAASLAQMFYYPDETVVVVTGPPLRVVRSTLRTN